MIPWNRFEVFFLKIPFSLISHLNSSSNLTKFQKISRKYLNSLWIRPVFTIIPLNSLLIPQIGKFGIIFDTRPCEIDDLAVSSRQWSLTDLKGLDPSLCTHRIFLEDESRPVKEAQRRVNPRVWDAVKKEILKWLNAKIIYPISNSQWVSPVHVVPKKAGVTVTMNEKGEEIQTRLPTKWRVCIDYRKRNSATKKDHFPLPFIDQILDRPAGSNYLCFLDGYSGYNQIAIHPNDQEKTTFTCPFGTFAFKRMPFGLCNAPATFQRCMTTIFSDFLGDSLEVFMDDFSIFGNDFETCLAHLTKILEVCVRKRLVLSWEKSHFMVREGVVLGHIVSGKGLEVDKANIEVIQNLPLPNTVKDLRSFLGHVGFYRRFIQDFAKVSKPLTTLLCKDKDFIIDKEGKHAFKTSRHQFYKVLIGTYPLRSCAALRTTLWERS